MSTIKISNDSIERTSVFEQIKEGNYFNNVRIHKPLQKMARLRSYYAHYRFPLELKKDLNLISGFKYNRSLLGEEDLNEVRKKAQELIDLVQEKVDKEWTKNRKLVIEEDDES